MKIKIRLSSNGKSVAAFLNSPSINGGLWWMSQRAERNAKKRLGVSPYDINLQSEHSFRVIDRNGYCVEYYRSER